MSTSNVVEASYSYVNPSIGRVMLELFLYDITVAYCIYFILVRTKPCNILLVVISLIYSYQRSLLKNMNPPYMIKLVCQEKSFLCQLLYFIYSLTVIGTFSNLFTMFVDIISYDYYRYKPYKKPTQPPPPLTEKELEILTSQAKLSDIASISYKRKKKKIYRPREKIPVYERIESALDSLFQKHNSLIDSFLEKIKSIFGKINRLIITPEMNLSTKFTIIQKLHTSDPLYVKLKYPVYWLGMILGCFLLWIEDRVPSIYPIYIMIILILLIHTFIRPSIEILKFLLSLTGFTVLCGFILITILSLIA